MRGHFQCWTTSDEKGLVCNCVEKHCRTDFKECTQSLYKYYVRVYLQSIKIEKSNPHDLGNNSTKKQGGEKDRSLTPHIQFPAFSFVVSWSHNYMGALKLLKIFQHMEVPKSGTTVISTSWAQEELLV